MTHLCAAIFVNDQTQAEHDSLAAARAGADLIELRIDRIRPENQPFAAGDEPRVTQNFSAGDIRRVTHVPCIITCRPTWEGGECTMPEEVRLDTLFIHSKESELVDLELAVEEQDALPLIKWRQANHRRYIASSHDFTGRPENLYSILTELNSSPCNIAKIVWTARTIRDNLEAFEILQTRQKPTIALCMGEAGLISRVLAKKFGAFLTFASLDGKNGTAPGQVSLADMKRLYRWDAIGAGTKVYGVVGYPVAHSMSPAIHNAAFDQAGHDGVYLPLLVNPGYESFKAFMESFVPFRGLDLSGLSITIPHKENALRYLKEKGCVVEPLAERIGAVNTITIRDQTLTGFNTDYAAILDSVTAKLQITREQLSEYRVAVIGAGGTGRTAVAAFAAVGATVVIYNRTREKADALAGEFNGKTGKVVSAAWEKLCDSCCQIYFNTTSIGMHPNVDEAPFDTSRLGSEVLVFDAVYNPLKTRLLMEAESGGAMTVEGIEMFVRQAAGQFRAWTGLGVPLELMRKVVEEKLKS